MNFCFVNAAPQKRGEETWAGTGARMRMVAGSTHAVSFDPLPSTLPGTGPMGLSELAEGDRLNRLAASPNYMPK